MENRRQSLPGASLAEVRRIAAERRPYQTVAYVLGAAMVLSGLFHLGVLLVDGGAWKGAVSWRKPVTFGLSFGLTTVTLAWIAGLLAQRRLLKVSLLALAISSALEVFIVSLQKWQGVASHFNFATPFDSAVFSAMGFAVSAIGLAILVFTGFAFGRVQGGCPMAIAVRAGLLLLVAAQVLGAAIIANGIAIDRPPTETDLAIFGTAGVMKLSHTVTMHAIQVLPALAVLLSVSPLDEESRVRVMWLAVASYVAVAAVSVLQRFQGRAPLDLGIAAAARLAAGAALAGVAAARFVADSRRTA